MMRDFIITAEDSVPYKHSESGKFCFITRDRRLIDQVSDRKDVVLKIFFEPLIDSLEDYIWGRHFEIELDEGGYRHEASNLYESTKIQNICAFYGLAPRVYLFGELYHGNRIFPFQLVEDAKEPIETDVHNRVMVFQKIKTLGKQIGFHSQFDDIGMKENIRGGKLIDFQGFKFSNDYESQMILRYNESTKWNGNTYQKYSNSEHYRSDRRISLLAKACFNNVIQFVDKKVIDLGCNGGEFSRFAWERGASKVKGIDLSHMIFSTFEVGNYEGYFDIDYLSLDLSKNKNVELDCDIVFFLSMKRHIGIPDNLFNVKTIIYEHNGDEPVEEFLRLAGKTHSYIDLGETGENDNRHMYVLTKRD